MQIPRRYAGTSLIRRPAIAISPLSGMRNPATRLSNVVLPQPDGPSSVISSPRRTISDTSSSAVVLPKRLVTPSSATAKYSPPLVRLAGATSGADSLPSAGLLNGEDLCKTEKEVGQYQHRCRDDNVDDRDRGHRGISVFAHVIVQGNREGLRALRCDEQRSGKFVEREDRREQPAGDETWQQEWHRDGREHAARRRAQARGREFQARVEIAQRDVDAAQHERQHEHHVASDDHRIAARQTDLGGEDQKSKADPEVRHHQRREQYRLQRALETKLVAIEREGKR